MINLVEYTPVERQSMLVNWLDMCHHASNWDQRNGLLRQAYDSFKHYGMRSRMRRYLMSLRPTGTQCVAELAFEQTMADVFRLVPAKKRGRTR